MVEWQMHEGVEVWVPDSLEQYSSPRLLLHEKYILILLN